MQKIAGIRKGPGWRLAALLIVLVLAASACKPEKTTTQKAFDLLQSGLEAHRKGRIEAATTAYRQVLVLDPNNKFAYYNLGLIDQLAGRSAAAEGNYRRALETDPDFPSALFNLAILLTPTNSQEALTFYKHLIDVKPDDPGGHLNLGFLLISLGRNDEGKAELDRAVALDPSLANRVQPQGTPSPTPTAPTTRRT